MGFKASGAALAAGLLFSLSFIDSCRAVEPFTPANFDWSQLQEAPQDQWSGLFLNLTETPQPMSAEHDVLFENGRPSVIGQDDVLLFPFSIGLSWQAFQYAAAKANIARAIQGCVTNDNTPGGVAGCAFGLAGTLFSIGSAYKAAAGRGWIARAGNTFDANGLDTIDLNPFSKRSQEDAQEVHEQVMRNVLRDNFGEAEFMGYVSEEHTLGRRNAEHLHSAAPIYRINHPRHGLIDIASREHIDSTRFTISYANDGLEKRQSFQHSRLSDHLMEARFDSASFNLDRSHPQFDASGGYQQIERAISCYARGNWQGNSVLSAQLFNTKARTTFGYASLGIFDNNNDIARLQAFGPTGLPLTVGRC